MYQVIQIRFWTIQIEESYNTFCRKGERLQNMYSVEYNRANTVLSQSDTTAVVRYLTLHHFIYKGENLLTVKFSAFLYRKHAWWEPVFSLQCGSLQYTLHLLWHKTTGYIHMIASALLHLSCEIKWFSLNWFHACLFIVYIISFLIPLHVLSKPSSFTLEM